jgi:hypothetical protein
MIEGPAGSSALPRQKMFGTDSRSHTFDADGSIRMVMNTLSTNSGAGLGSSGSERCAPANTWCASEAGVLRRKLQSESTATWKDAAHAICRRSLT